jgi:RecA-family ATPase
MTVAELQRQEFPPMTYVVPNIIPEGVTVLAGRPKIGKSWLALELCLGVSGDMPVLGNIKPATGDSLYLALEDNPRRLQRRIDKVVGSPFSGHWPERCAISTTWNRLDKGGAEEIEEWIETVPEPRLVVLDTLAAFRPEKPSQNTQYQIDYGAIDKLQKIAGDKHLAILVLAHDRKMAADDPIDAVSGTLGLTGCADGVAIITRNSQGTTLYLRGRDVEEQELAIVFDKASCRWRILGEAGEVHMSDSRKRILDALLAATEPQHPKDVADACEMSSGAVKRQLERMARAGEVARVSRGRYVHPERSDLHSKGKQKVRAVPAGEKVVRLVRADGGDPSA